MNSRKLLEDFGLTKDDLVDLALKHMSSMSKEDLLLLMAHADIEIQYRIDTGDYDFDDEEGGFQL